MSRTTVDKDLGTLKAFFNWAIGRHLAVANPLRRVKMFREDNTRLRYLTRDEYERLIEAAGQVTTSPYLVEKIVLAAHTGLRRGSLFNLRSEQFGFANRVMRIPRTKSGRPLSVPLNQTALETLQRLHNARMPTSPWVFPHKTGASAVEPVFADGVARASATFFKLLGLDSNTRAPSVSEATRVLEAGRGPRMRSKIE